MSGDIASSFNFDKQVAAVKDATKRGGRYLPSFKQAQQSIIKARSLAEVVHRDGAAQANSKRSGDSFLLGGKAQFNSFSADEQKDLLRLTNEGEGINTPEPIVTETPIEAEDTTPNNIVSDKKRGTRKQAPSVLSSKTTQKGTSRFSLLSGRSGGLLGN